MPDKSISEIEKELLTWGNDALSAEVNNQVQAMPDRPQVVLVVISHNLSAEKANDILLRGLGNNYLRMMPMKWYDRPYRVTYLGFDEHQQGFMSAVLLLDQVDWDESVLFIDGLPKLILRKPFVKTRNKQDLPPAAVTLPVLDELQRLFGSLPFTNPDPETMLKTIRFKIDQLRALKVEETLLVAIEEAADVLLSFKNGDKGTTASHILSQIEDYKDELGASS